MNENDKSADSCIIVPLVSEKPEKDETEVVVQWQLHSLRCFHCAMN